ncbi:MAG: hypothetical protein JXA10_08370 [Anaerolineae bacterium]|nr:hypothetical protein [Anaerolineae bacterium]
MCRSLVLLLIVTFSLFLSLTSHQSLNADTSPLQASETPMPAVPLSFYKTMTGTLQPGEETARYTFEVPVNQDVVVAFEADKFIMDRHCVRITTPTTEQEDCPFEGGGGGDAPISQTLVIPATNQPETRQTVEFWLVRPVSLEGPATYQFTAYPVTPQPLTPKQRMDAILTPTVPYQMYMLEADQNQPFTIQIEDAAADGDFMWAAYQPYLPYLGEQLTLSEDRQLVLQWVDGTQRDDNLNGIAQLYLYYLGGNDFRVFVKSTGDYSVVFTPSQAQTLAENLMGLVTVTYQDPMQTIRLDTSQGDVVTIDLKVVEGTGARVSVYTEGGEWQGHYSILGPNNITDTVNPLFDTIEHTVTIDSDVIVIVQIPPVFTRSQATLQVTWQRKS